MKESIKDATPPSSNVQTFKGDRGKVLRNWGSNYFCNASTAWQIIIIKGGSIIIPKIKHKSAVNNHALPRVAFDCWYRDKIGIPVYKTVQ